jgi:hypothetical protein
MKLQVVNVNFFPPLYSALPDLTRSNATPIPVCSAPIDHVLPLFVYNIHCCLIWVFAGSPVGRLFSSRKSEEATYTNRYRWMWEWKCLTCPPKCYYDRCWDSILFLPRLCLCHKKSCQDHALHFLCSHATWGLIIMFSLWIRRTVSL